MNICTQDRTIIEARHVCQQNIFVYELFSAKNLLGISKSTISAAEYLRRTTLLRLRLRLRLYYYYSTTTTTTTATTSATTTENLASTDPQCPVACDQGLCRRRSVTRRRQLRLVACLATSNNCLPVRLYYDYAYDCSTTTLLILVLLLLPLLLLRATTATTSATTTDNLASTDLQCPVACDQGLCRRRSVTRRRQLRLVACLATSNNCLPVRFYYDYAYDCSTTTLLILVLLLLPLLLLRATTATTSATTTDNLASTDLQCPVACDQGCAGGDL
ncbi:hypothetical protein BOX15_Mlig029405g1 [Macrostomum lignano]|uniref:Uncharacterized protein n=1 Tax=Macrostomum lignano TaxID=282301 RepID=A0A267H9A5_9PLAT|nr:hypothetical protein BOX15_Mlig029405g1 [Macrostomum lignano]